MRSPTSKMASVRRRTSYSFIGCLLHFSPLAPKSEPQATSFASHNSLAKMRCLPSDASVSGLPTDEQITQTESVGGLIKFSQKAYQSTPRACVAHHLAVGRDGFSWNLWGFPNRRGSDSACERWRVIVQRIRRSMNLSPLRPSSHGQSRRRG